MSSLLNTTISNIHVNIYELARKSISCFEIMQIYLSSPEFQEGFNAIH